MTAAVAERSIHERARELLRRHGNPFRNYFARNPDDESQEDRPRMPSALYGFSDSPVGRFLARGLEQRTAGSARRPTAVYNALRWAFGSTSPNAGEP